MIFCHRRFGVGLAKQQCCGSQPQGHLATFADSFNGHSWGRGRRLPAGVQGAEVRGAGEHPTVYRTDPHNKAYLASNINCVRVDRPRVGIFQWYFCIQK